MRAAVAAIYIATIRQQLHGTDSLPMHEVRVRDHTVAGQISSTCELLRGGSLESGSITTTAPYCASPQNHMLDIALYGMVPIPSCTRTATNDSYPPLLEACSPLVQCTNEVPFYDTDVNHVEYDWKVCIVRCISSPKQDPALVFWSEVKYSLVMTQSTYMYSINVRVHLQLSYVSQSCVSIKGAWQPHSPDSRECS